MKALKVLPLALAAVASLTFVSVPAQARTAAEDTHCLALGYAFSALGEAGKELAKQERAKLTGEATAEQKAQIDQYEDFGSQATDIGAALKRNFASAKAPSDAEIAALGDASIEDLIAQGNACVD